MRLYGKITKAEPQDDGTIKVYGVASSPALDAHGEIVTTEAMKAAIPDYLAFPTIREMHDAQKAAGRAVEIDVDDEGKTNLVAHVVDPVAINKVKHGVYAGFSIGGRIKKRDDIDRKKITGLELLEISLVDRPSCPEAVVNLWKSDVPAQTEEDEPLEKAEGDAEPTAEFDELAAELAKVNPAEGEAVAEAKPAEELAKAESEAEANPHALLKEIMARLDRIEKGAPETVAEAAPEPATEAKLEPVARAMPPALMPGLELRKGLWSVNSLGNVLLDLAYIIYNADYEAEDEGDNSPVPAKLRDAFRALADAYRSMSDEELAELVASVTGETMVRGAVAALADLNRLDFTPEHANDVTKAILPLLPKGVALAEPVAEPKPETIERLAKAESSVESLTAERDELRKSVDSLTEGLSALAMRVEKLAAEPLPPRTAGSQNARAVEKSEDNGGGRAALSEADVMKVLAALPPDQRAMMLIKAAHANPVVAINR